MMFTSAQNVQQFSNLITKLTACYIMGTFHYSTWSSVTVYYSIK